MEGLELADYFDGSQDTIYVLVGSDFYWDIMIGDIVSGDGPTAISSKLGWLLSGPVKGATTDNYVVSNGICHTIIVKEIETEAKVQVFLSIFAGLL